MPFYHIRAMEHAEHAMELCCAVDQLGKNTKQHFFQRKTQGHKIFSMIAFIFDVFFYHTPFTWSLRCSYKAVGYIAKMRNKTTIQWNNNSLAALKSPLQN